MLRTSKFLSWLSPQTQIQRTSIVLLHLPKEEALTRRGRRRRRSNGKRDGEDTMRTSSTNTIRRDALIIIFYQISMSVHLLPLCLCFRQSSGHVNQNTNYLTNRIEQHMTSGTSIDTFSKSERLVIDPRARAIIQYGGTIL